MEQTPQHIKQGVRFAIGVAAMVAVFFAGVSIGYENRPAAAKVVGLVHKETPETLEAKTDFNTFWKAWQIVDDKFPAADDTSDTDRVYGAIKGLLASFGDPYTTFFSPEENEIFQTQISGEFNGIGIEIGQKDGLLTVIAPLKGTPAYQAGIKAGDKIIKIDETVASDMTIDKAIGLIRGASGTKVTLTILREKIDEPLVFSITRATITLPTVETSVRESEGVFIISLYNFSSHSVELFHNALEEYIASGKTNLILDLRGNPGGYLEAAVDISSMFLPQGKVVVKEVGKTPDDINVHLTRGRKLFPQGHKLVILVDKGSASASEIVAGALSEHQVGTLVGVQTFGKGSVQEVINLTSDTSMKVTVAKWYTPEGISISESGLSPKVEIKQGDTKGVDTQLDAAVALFKKL